MWWISSALIHACPPVLGLAVAHAGRGRPCVVGRSGEALAAGTGVAGSPFPANFSPDRGSAYVPCSRAPAGFPRNRINQRRTPCDRELSSATGFAVVAAAYGWLPTSRSALAHLGDGQRCPGCCPQQRTSLNPHQHSPAIAELQAKIGDTIAVRGTPVQARMEVGHLAGVHAHTRTTEAPSWHRAISRWTAAVRAKAGDMEIMLPSSAG